MVASVETLTGTPGFFGTTRVTGPGQKAAASLRAEGGRSRATCSSWSGSASRTAIALVWLRPLTLYSRSTPAGSKTPVLFAGPDGSAEALRAEKALKGPVYVASAFHASAGPVCEQFVRKYREQYHTEPDAHAALAYDAAWLLFGGLRQARPLDGPRAAARGLASLETFDSLTGSIPLAKLRRGERPLFLLRVEEGQDVVAQRYDVRAYR